MTPADLTKFEPARCLATLVALALEGTATVLDELLDLHDRMSGKVFNAAKNKHQQQFQASGKAINQRVRLFGRIDQVWSGYVLTLFRKLSCKTPLSRASGVVNATTVCPLSWPWWAKSAAAS